MPSKFSYTQIGVRAFFTLTSATMLLAYAGAICGRGRRELGQLWVCLLLVLLIALNDPLYILRVHMGGSHSLYVASVFGQILFSGCLFLFWLVYADGMNTADGQRDGCCFYVPKVLLVATYVIVSAVSCTGECPHQHERRPPTTRRRCSLSRCSAVRSSLSACGSLRSSRRPSTASGGRRSSTSTEREKSFVGITVVFVILSLCGHLCAVHGRRGSWMQLQLPSSAHQLVPHPARSRVLALRRRVCRARRGQWSRPLRRGGRRRLRRRARQGTEPLEDDDD